MKTKRTRARPRYSWHALETYKPPTIADPNGTAPSNNDWALLLGVRSVTIAAWRRNGLTETQADRVACHRLGVHPSHIWPEWFPE